MNLELHPNKIKVIEATTKDLEQVVSLHQQTFNTNFTTSLGSRFLTEYYRIFLQTDFVFLVAKKDKNLVGFIIGANDYKDISKNMRARFYLFLPSLLMSLRYKNIKAITYRIYNFLTKSRANSLPSSLKTKSEITSLAVDRKERGEGIGKLLVNQSLYEFQQKKSTSIFLTTDAQNNTKTLSFYKSRGFSIVHTYKQSNKREMHIMIKDLNDQQSEKH